MQDGFAAATGAASSESAPDCAAIELGLRSIAYASSVVATGNTPVRCDGRPLPVTERFAPVTTIRRTDFQATAPSTVILAVESQVVPWIHEPAAWGPPPPTMPPHEKT